MRKRAGKLARHAFVQFPTDIEITPATEEMMLREAVTFIEKTHGGQVVFRARLDRDERGKNGVDAFFAPRYSKTTAAGTQDWISLTKFGKALARERLGQRQLETKNPETSDWAPQFDDGNPKMVWNDSACLARQARSCMSADRHGELHLRLPARSAIIGADTKGMPMRKFLVVLDDSRECLNAMRFAAMRAARTNGGVEVLSVIPPEEFNHWLGVGDLMREEARERIHAHFEVFAKWMRDRQGVDPELVIREGEAVSEILAQANDNPEIGVLVLGAGTDKSGPGPLVTALAKASGSLSIPITIVPGGMTRERLEAIT